jgi:Ca-activated chloride channel family protein
MKRMQPGRLGAAATFSAILALLAACPPARGDGMIIPQGEARIRGEWAVKYHHVDIHVANQVAEVSIDQAFVNIGRSPIEVEYVFPIPPGAGIDKLTLIADGNEIKGELLKADDARRIFEDIVRRKKDPALLEYVGYGLYKTRVFPIPAGGQRRVQLHYTAECKRQGDLVSVEYPLNTEKFSAKAIDDVSVTVDIRGAGTIGPVYSPSHDLEVKRDGESHVIARYHVTNAIPTTDFSLLFQDQARQMGATVLSYKPKATEDGYFMILVSPQSPADRPKAMPKDIICIIDHSGSMSGKKIEQARNSLKLILQGLNEKDRFNLVSFNDTVEVLFNTPLAPADGEHVDKASQWVERIEAGGATNIAEALTRAARMMFLAMNLSDISPARPAYIIFLTDGQPTVGPRDEQTILKLVEQANQGKARLFCLGIGYDVNVKLIDLLAARQRGYSEYVKENEPLEAKVSGLYAKVKNPVLTDVQVNLGDAQVHYLYPDRLGDLFEGQQVVLVGRYAKGGKCELGLAGQYMGKKQEHKYPVTLEMFSEDNALAYLPRVWAMRRVGFLMDQVALNGDNKEIIDEIIRLSRDYGIMTPYTSFLAEEDTHLGDAVSLRDKAANKGALSDLSISSGEAAQRQAVTRGQLRSGVNAAPAATAAPAGGPGSQPLGFYGGAMVGNTDRDKYEAGKVETVANLRQVNNTTLYRRSNQWFTPDLAKQVEENKLEAAKTLRQFSTDWFDLSHANTRAENELLASQQAGEELIVTLRGQMYRILPADTK